MSKKERKIIYRIEEDKIIEKRYQRFLLLLAKDFLNKKKEVEIKKLNLIKIYKDEAISGTSVKNRENFIEMIAESKNKTFDYVIVHKYDRFARNRYDHAIYEKKLNDNNVKLLSVLEEMSDSPENVILKSVLTGMNEYYSLNLSREVKKGQIENIL